MVRCSNCGGLWPAGLERCPRDGADLSEMTALAVLDDTWLWHGAQ